MAKRVDKFYSRAEKSALLAQIDRLYQAGGRTYVSIARELGLGDTSYHRWLSQGIKPARARAPVVATPVSPRVFIAAEREQMVADIDGLRARGNSMKSACMAVGISDKSYRNWKEALAPRLPMRQVEVTAMVPAPTAGLALTLVPPMPAAGAPALTLVAPGGYRIEGLCIETAARLLRALA
jgi:transposase-like protein